MVYSSESKKFPRTHSCANNLSYLTISVSQSSFSLPRFPRSAQPRELLSPACPTRDLLHFVSCSSHVQHHTALKSLHPGHSNHHPAPPAALKLPLRLPYAADLWNRSGQTRPRQSTGALRARSVSRGAAGPARRRGGRPPAASLTSPRRDGRTDGRADGRTDGRAPPRTGSAASSPAAARPRAAAAAPPRARPGTWRPADTARSPALPNFGNFSFPVSARGLLTHTNRKPRGNRPPPLCSQTLVLTAWEAKTNAS